jgi:FtsH-binding integral membrane protein
MDTTLSMPSYRSATEINAAMGRVYFHMMLAVVTSMLVSYWVGSSAELMQFLFGTWVKWLVIFAPLVAVFGVTIAINANPPRPVAVGLLHGFAAIMGLSIATVFAVFAMSSIVTAFMGAAILFGTMSVWGYFTKQDLHSWGRYLLIGLIAIVLASIVNIFVGSSAMQMLISAVAIVLFLALTAYDTQNIREQVSVDGDTTAAEILGALSLYINFINIFVSLLQLFGDRKE